MSEDIRKGPVWPVRAEAPSAPPDNRGIHSGAEPRFPWLMASAGAIWTLAAVLLLMLALLVFYEVRSLFNPYAQSYYREEVIWLFRLLVLAPTIVAALSAAAFIRADARIRRGTAQGGPIRGLAVYSLVVGLLLSCLSWLTVPDILLVLRWMESHPLPGETRYWENVLPLAALGGLAVPAGLLLLTAGVLALAGASRWVRWQKARETLSAARRE